LVRLKGFQKLTSTETALQTWLKTLQIQPQTTTIPLKDALNRVIAEDVTAKENLPRFDKSAMDGYALKAEDTTGANQFKPVTLQLTDSDVVNSKQAKQIWTGQPIPKGANAVMPLENTQQHNNGQLKIYAQAALNDNISKKGEDIKKGETAAKAGTRLTPCHLGLLTAIGNTTVKVTEKPKIAIIATGNELVEAGTQPAENQINEANKITISAMTRQLDAEPIDLGITKDDTAAITEKIRTALAKADAVITTGGTSVGGLDLVPDAVNKAGKLGVIIHGVALRPAMPTALAAINGKPVIILSGNPVAAVIGFEVFARPLICKMLSMPQTEPRPTVQAVITRRTASALGRKTFIRVKVTQTNNEYHAEPVSARGSGTITTMTHANGFVIVPENREGIPQGETVTVHLFSNVETVN
jgi:molybdopterin molybdotransferase